MGIQPITPGAAMSVASSTAATRSVAAPKSTATAPTDTVEISSAARKLAAGDKDGDGNGK